MDVKILEIHSMIDIGLIRLPGELVNIVGSEEGTRWRLMGRIDIHKKVKDIRTNDMI